MCIASDRVEMVVNGFRPKKLFWLTLLCLSAYAVYTLLPIRTDTLLSSEARPLPVQIQENFGTNSRLETGQFGSIPGAGMLDRAPKGVQLKISPSCDLDWRGITFNRIEDTYDSFRIPAEEITREGFTRKRTQTNAEPVFNDPIIKLNTSRFIIADLIRGPNNQLIGLRETIYVAIRLNRTLIIPRFFKHYTDSTMDLENTIHPAHRVDFDEVCRFVSCASLQQFREACGNRIDELILLRRYLKGEASKLESLTGCLISADEKTGLKKMIPQYKDNYRFGSSEGELRQLFGFSDQCVVYGKPFMNTHFESGGTGQRVMKQSDLQRVTDDDLYQEITRRASQPKYIVEIAQNFVRDVIGDEKLMGVHWRFDKGDWMLRCYRDDVEDARKEACDEAKLVEPIDVAAAILEKLRTVSEITGEISTLYIASPPSQEEFISNVMEVLSGHGIKSFTLQDLTDYMSTRYKSCTFLEKDFNDILSTTEMQICLRSSVFFKSTRSSWSSNISQWRSILQIPGTFPDSHKDIFRMAVDSARSRIEKTG